MQCYRKKKVFCHASLRAIATLDTLLKQQELCVHVYSDQFLLDRFVLECPSSSRAVCTKEVEERAARQASNILCSVRTLCPCWQTTVSASLMFCVDDVTDADFLARIEVLTAVWISIAFECMQ